MDEIVLRAIAKWPKVPAVYGWLRLDRRGDWWIKDERVHNSALIAYIGRNYDRDERGRWFFQNGPQRVYVALDYVPFVYRVAGPEGGAPDIEAHTGRVIRAASSAWIDEEGALLLETEFGVGVVHDHDLDRLVPRFVDPSGSSLAEDALEALMERLRAGGTGPLRLQLRAGAFLVEPIRRAEVAARFGFVPKPEPVRE